MNYYSMLANIKKENALFEDIKAILNSGTALSEANHRTNHENCPAGTDTKRRLYIKKEGNVLLGHCFNCGKSGWYFKNKKTVLSLDEITSLGTDVIHPTPSFDPVDEVYHTQLTPVLSTDIKVWLTLHGIEEKDYAYLGLKENSTFSTLYLPVMDVDNQCVGYVVRNFDDYGFASRRYINVFKENKKQGCYIWPPEKLVLDAGITMDHGVLVITEDIISAYRVSRATGYHALALLGTQMQDATLESILGCKYKTVYIWLDKDMAGMSKAAPVSEAVLGVICDEVGRIICNTEEPKKLSDEEIRRVLHV
jgi:hypothetical protein